MSKSKKDKPLSLPPENPNLKLKGSSRTPTHFDQRGQKVSDQYNATNIEIHGNVAGNTIIIGNENEVALDKIIICPKCKHENSKTAKSCVKCSTLLIFTCPICKAETPMSSKFCSGCGQEISLLIEQSKKKDDEK